MMYWNYIVVALCLLLLIFLVWKEVRRANKAWLILRLTASILAVAGFACMALPLSYKQTQNVGGSKAVALLTTGFNRDSVQKFANENGGKKQVFYLEDDTKALEIPGATLLVDLAELNQPANTNAIHVFGEGLDEATLQSLKGTPLLFHRAEISTGITAANWLHTLNAGERLYVQGQFRNTLAKEVKLLLYGFSTNLDSLTIPAKSSQAFELATTPKHAGRAVYSIIALAKNDTVAKEPVPVEVQPAVPIKFLLLAASPDFENRFLKNWLAQNAYAVAVRTTISKNKFSKEFLNVPVFALDRVSPTVLDKFDAVIADARELANLSRQEQATLQNYVDQKGLGLVIKADSSLGAAAFYTRSFSLVQSTSKAAQAVKLHLADSITHLPDLLITQPFYIRPQATIQPMVADQQARVFAGNTLYGTGRVMVSTLSDTYQWVLAGKSDAYTIFWSAILNRVAKKPPSSERWSTGPAIPRIHQPVQFMVETSGSEVPRGQVGTTFVYMQQGSRLPYLWTGTFWPEAAGWQAGMQTDGTAYWWYAYRQNDYSNIRAIDRTKQTARYAEMHPFQKGKVLVETKNSQVEFPKIWFFLLVLLCCGFLWLERKFL